MRTKHKLNIIANIVGLLASLGGMVLTIILLYFNPYGYDGVNSGTVSIAYTTLFAPALSALVTILFKKPGLMFISFLWSLPISFYLRGTPGIFKMFGVICILYLVTALLFLLLLNTRNETI